MKKTVLSFVFWGTALFSFSQESVLRLSIPQLFQLAEDHSQELKVSELSVQASEEDIKVAKNGLLPTFDVSLSAGYLSDLRITDRNFSNGQTIKMKNFGDLANFTNSLAVEATYLVYSGGAVQNGIRNAKMANEISQQQQVQTRQNVRFLLLSYYLDLFRLTNQEEVYLKNIEQTKILVENIQNKHSEGMALKNDITRHELHLQSLELALKQTRNAKSIAQNKLCTLLKLAPETIVEVDQSILENLPIADEEQTWQETATSSSPILKISDIKTNIAENNVKIAKSDRLPHIALYASDQLNGPITIDMDVKDNNMNLWTVGVGVTYNLASLYKSGRNIRKAKTDSEIAKAEKETAMENLQIEVNSAHTLFLESFSILETCEKSLELAVLNYNVVNNRYVNDLALITDMLDASNSKIEAELNMANAKINIVLKYYNLKRASGDL